MCCHNIWCSPRCERDLRIEIFIVTDNYNIRFKRMNESRPTNGEFRVNALSATQLEQLFHGDRVTLESGMKWSAKATALRVRGVVEATVTKDRHRLELPHFDGGNLLRDAGREK